jgi:hypothetical protein
MRLLYLRQWKVEEKYKISTNLNIPAILCQKYYYCINIRNKIARMHILI